MNPFQNLISPQLLEAIGAALLHSLWQIALVAGLLWMALRVFQSTNTRYVLCTAALALMALLPVATGIQVYLSAPISTFKSITVLDTDDQLTGNRLTGDHLEQKPPVESQSTSHDGLDPAQSTSQLNNWQPIAVFLWLIGVVFFSIRLAGGLFTVARLKRNGIPIADPAIDSLYQALAARMGIARPAKLRSSTQTDQPLIIGWLKPVILLPASMLTGIHPKHVEAILAHELAHVRRHDYLVSLAQSVMETLFFYHPAIWWVSSRIRIEREYCCDDLAVAVLENKTTYVQALAGLEGRRIPALAPSAAGGRLVDRVRRLVGDPRKQNSSWAPILLTVLVCSTLVVACEKATFVTPDIDSSTLEYEIPAPLLRMISSKDIEGTITYLHDIREEDHPDAFEIAKAAYHAASDEKLRRNLVYVFAHFNTTEADKFLISIVKGEESPSVQGNALRAFQLRQRETSRFGLNAYRLFREQGELFEYPEFTAAQLEAIEEDLIDIILDPEQPVHHLKTSALRIFQKADWTIERSILEEVISRSNDIRVQVTALEFLENKVEAANRMAGLYSQSLDNSSIVTIASGIAQSGIPEAVPLILGLVSQEKPGFDPMPFTSISQLHSMMRRLSPSDRQTARVLIQDARSSYEADDYRAKRLGDVLDYIEHLGDTPRIEGPPVIVSPG